MKELFINKARTCAVTGHRAIGKDFDRDRLKGILNSLTEIGYDTFLVGMAIGFDTICFQVLEEIRKEKPIKIIACIPCATQAVKFNSKQKDEYDRMLLSSDENYYVSIDYDESCMMRRNRFMVDNASVLVSYLRHETGGTKATVNYAKKQKIKIIET